MSFGTPVVLWGLLGPFLGALTLAVLAVLRRHRAWTRWPGITRVVAIGAHVRPVTVGRGTRRPWLLLLALALALVALARPRWGVIEEPVVQKSREVMIALDLSRSMLVQDVPPSRLERSRLLVRSLLDGLRGERVGLIVFSGTAFVQVPMSSDYQILEEFLPELKPDYMPQGGSDYDGLLRAAVGGFSPASDTDRYLIVLSDGEAQDEAWRKQLPALKEKGIHVIALGVGTTAGGFIPDVKTGAYLKDQRGAVVLSKLEPATLQALAFETAGTYRDASAWVDLAAVLQETVERGRQGVFGDKREARAIERFQWFLFPALLAALLGVWREIPVRPRPRVIRTTAGARAMPAIPRVAARTVARAGALLVIAALASTLAPRLRAAVADTTPTDTVDKLRATVTRLAAVDAVAPAGWKAMAEQTLALGQELLQAKQPLEPGLVRDALAAVDQGEARDPRAADWKKLREDLQRLLEPPQQQPQPDEQQKQDQQQKKDSQDQQQQSGQQGEPKDEKSKEKQPEQSDQQKQDQQQQPQQQQAQKQDSALGDLEKPPELQPQPQPQSTPQKPQTRKFGGKQDTEQKQTSTDPELAAALARLEQVQENDSPARLHQRIEEEARRQEKQGPAPANPHDW